MIRTKVRHALDETRMLVLGAQVLLGFEVRAFFEPRFDVLPSAERWLRLAGFSAVLGGLGVLLGPAARHRLAVRGPDTPGVPPLLLGCAEARLQPFPLA